jgi:anti-sigma factor RsiW
MDDTVLCAYVDGELDARSAHEVEVAASSNPGLRRRIEMFQRSRKLLRAALSEDRFVDVPPRLKQTIRNARSPSRWQIAARPYALAMAAGVVLCLALGAAAMRLIEHGYILPVSGVGFVLREVAEYHPVYAREEEHLVEVAASRREHIEEWLGGRLGLDLKAPDLVARGLTFRGARLVALENQVLAQLMYTDAAKQRYALCATKLVGAPGRGFETLVENGLRLRGVSHGEHVFLIVGPDDTPLVDELARDLPALLSSDLPSPQS